MDGEDGYPLTTSELATPTVTWTFDTAPVAGAGGPYVGDEGSPIALSGAGSLDDSAIVAYAWDCDGDGAYDDASGVSATCTFADDGVFVVGLEVTDDIGQTGTTTTTVIVANVAPTFTSTPPLAAMEGDLWTYTAAATDPGADAITFSTVGAPSSMTVSGDTFSWTPTFADVGPLTFDIVADDGDGGTTPQAIALTVGFIDDDGDGLPDTWEGTNGLDITVDDSALDPDGDGVSNLDEYLGGTDPQSYDGPAAPVLVAPIDDAEVATATPELTWTNAVDPQNEALTYEVEVYADAAMATLLESVADLAEGVGTSAWTPSTAADENALGYWRVRASDPHVAGAWSDLESFFVNAVEEAPAAPTAADPLEGQSVAEVSPTFTWTEPVDPDGDPLSYEVELLDLDGAVVEAGVAGDLVWQTAALLAEDTDYTWQVRALDDTGLTSDWSVPQTFFVDTANHAPTDIAWVNPEDGAVLDVVAPALEVTESADPERQAVTYVFEADTVATFDSEQHLRGAADEPRWDLAAEELALPENTDVHLRVRAEDAAGAASAWATIVVTVRGPNDAPTVPMLRSPEDGVDLGEEPTAPTLEVAGSSDPEGDAFTYTFVVASDAGLSDVLAEGDGDGTWVSTAALDPGTYYWSARAVDEHGAASEYAEAWTFVVPEPSGCAGCESSVAGAEASGVALLLFVVVARRRRVSCSGEYAC